MYIYIYKSKLLSVAAGGMNEFKSLPSYLSDCMRDAVFTILNKGNENLNTNITLECTAAGDYNLVSRSIVVKAFVSQISEIFIQWQRKSRYTGVKP